MNEQEQYVYDLYASILGRAPDPQGFADNLAALQSGRVDAAGLANAFSSSQEAQSNSGGGGGGGGSPAPAPAPAPSAPQDTRTYEELLYNGPSAGQGGQEWQDLLYQAQLRAIPTEPGLGQTYTDWQNQVAEKQKANALATVPPGQNLTYLSTGTTQTQNENSGAPSTTTKNLFLDANGGIVTIDASGRPISYEPSTAWYNQQLAANPGLVRTTDYRNQTYLSSAGLPQTYNFNGVEVPTVLTEQLVNPQTGKLAQDASGKTQAVQWQPDTGGFNNWYLDNGWIIPAAGMAIVGGAAAGGLIAAEGAAAGGAAAGGGAAASGGALTVPEILASTGFVPAAGSAGFTLPAAGAAGVAAGTSGGFGINAAGTGGTMGSVTAPSAGYTFGGLSGSQVPTLTAGLEVGAGGALGGTAAAGAAAGALGSGATGAAGSVIGNLTAAELAKYGLTAASLAGAAGFMSNSKPNYGDGGAAALEAARQKRVTEATNAINSIFNNSNRKSLYDNQRSAIYDLNANEVNRQATVAERTNRFGLARNGLIGGSADIDSNSELNRKTNAGLLQAGGIADQSVADLQAADEKTRSNLISMAQTGIDTGSAASMAMSGLNANLNQATAQRGGAAIGSLFNDLSQAYLYNQQQQGNAIGTAYGRQNYGNSIRTGSQNGVITNS